MVRVEAEVGVDGTGLCDAVWMKFTLEQRFRMSPEEVLAMLTDESFWNGVDGLTTMSTPRVLDIIRRGDHITTRLGYDLVVDLPGEAARFINTSAVSWVEVTEWHVPSSTSHTTFVPDQAARLLVASVETSLHPDGPGTRRDVSGEVRVRIPLLGSKVESAIVGGVEQYLAELSEAVDERGEQDPAGAPAID